MRSHEEFPEAKMYSIILVPIDIDETSLIQSVIPHVQTQSVINTTQVHFLTVIPSLPYYSALGMAFSAEMPRVKDLQKDVLLKLDDIVKQFKLPNFKIKTHVIVGTPKDKILEFAGVIGADLIIISSHRPDISTYLLGSNASAVVRYAKCPVLVVR
jgi:universal stress protein F